MSTHFTTQELDLFNGPDGAQHLPVPATFLVDRKRRGSIGPRRRGLHAAAGSRRRDHHVRGTYGVNKKIVLATAGNQEGPSVVAN
jgi:hypothetical protein